MIQQTQIKKYTYITWTILQAIESQDQDDHIFSVSVLY